ncbi:MAG: ABC transporter ATP-binding protein [Spirochaetes bacterium]|nr:MAG: ABC transporter ATP-binding protein [Spirochaetota bacterium]
MSETLLSMRKITKRFPGVLANDEISFDLFKGEIHALVGENGAGKTTLMKILYGLYSPDSGEIYIKGKRITIKNPKEAINGGIGMVHQHFMLVPPFTVLENIIIGEETKKFGLLDESLPAEKIKALMEKNGLIVDLNSRVEDVPVGLQQRVEILKILYRGAEILVFDEPTAVLTPQEVEDLFKTFRQLISQGKGIVFISHKLDEVLEIADRITVIRKGRVIKTLNRDEATKSLIAELMVGKPVLLEVSRPDVKEGPAVLEVKYLSLQDYRKVNILTDVSFTVHAGEIYGIAGVEGNGQTELVEVIAEAAPILHGDILLNGESITNWDVRQRREAGISHIPEDRHRYGLLLPFSLAENLTLGMHHKEPFVNRFQIINKNKIREHAKAVIEKFDIRTPSELTTALALSGGNQQKVIVARELSTEPKLLLAAQPTRGVDIGATEFIHNQLMIAKKEGRAVLLVSADLDEVMSLSDRIGVMFKGRIIKEFEREKTTKEEIGFYMMGEKEHAGN